MRSALIASDWSDLRARLESMVRAVPDIGRVQLVSTSAQMLARFGADHPDVVIFGCAHGSDFGPGAVRGLLATYPAAAVILLGSASDPAAFAGAVGCGARAYLSLDVSPLELGAAIAQLDDLSSATEAAPGSVYAAAGRRTDRGMRARSELTAVLGASAGDARGRTALTSREHQVLAGMSQGMTNNEIGALLFVSEDTIKSHAHRLFRKLGARDRAEAVAQGFRRGLVK